MNLPLLLLLLLLFFYLSPPLSSPTSAQPIPGFVSLDCGSSATAPYKDTSTGLYWETDASFGLADASLTTPIQPPDSSAALVSNEQLKSIRYFPGAANRTKYCYTFDDGSITVNATYLVRATFWSGASAAGLPFSPKSADGVLRFQLLLNADVWTNVSISIPQKSVVQEEVFVVALTPSISVCLTGAGASSSAGWDTPFISSLEIRRMPIDDDQIVPLSLAIRPSATTTRAVYTAFRLDYGSSTGISVRYPDDRYDRIWQAQTSTPQLSTTANISVRSSNYPPVPVMQTAYTYDGNFTINFTNVGESGYYSALYFAEISPDVNATGQRIFSYTRTTGASDTYLGGLSNLDIFSEDGKYSTYFGYSTSAFSPIDNFFTFTFTKNETSLFGPLLNALEIFRISDKDASSGTDDVDAAAVRSIVLSFPAALASWTGDPCLPYRYDWLRCDSRDRPRIVSVTLAHEGLSGGIPPAIANLTELQILDLQGNNLSGSIPSFLGNLPKLNTLLLQDNNFSGNVPPSLVDKSNTLELNLSVAGNPYLCTTSLENSNSTNSCTNSPSSTSSSSSSQKKDNIVPIVVGGCIGGVLLIFLGIVTFYLVRKCSKQKDIAKYGDKNATQMATVPKEEGAYVINQVDVNQIYCFTYQDMEKITNSFSNKLGRGGFGDVFYGRLSHGAHVAIKVSSKVSQQGAQAFLNEKINLEN